MGGQAGAARPPQLTKTGCSPPELSGPGMIQEVPSSNWNGHPDAETEARDSGRVRPTIPAEPEGCRGPSGLTLFTDKEVGPGAKVLGPQNSPGRVRPGGCPAQPMPASCSAPTENWHRPKRVSSGGPSQQQPQPPPLSFAETAHQPTPAQIHSPGPPPPPQPASRW